MDLVSRLFRIKRLAAAAVCLTLVLFLQGCESQPFLTPIPPANCAWQLGPGSGFWNVDYVDASAGVARHLDRVFVDCTGLLIVTDCASITGASAYGNDDFNADVSIALSGPFTAPGGNNAVTVTVTNNSDNTARGVELEGLLPGAVQTASFPALPISCITESGQPAGLVYCRFHCSQADVCDDILSPHESVHFPLIFASGGDPNDQAFFFIAGACDFNQQNNTVARTMQAADLTVYQTHINLTFAIFVTNNGPQTATAVALADTLDPNLSIESAITTQGTCGYDANSRTLRCALGTLAKGATATITIDTFSNLFSGSVTNTASVSSATYDPNPANNSFASTVRIEPI